MTSATSFPRTPDGEQLLINPWIAPDERIDVLNEMAEADSHTPQVRAIVARALADLPANADTRAVWQRLLNAVFETVVYRPDPASDQDFYQPTHVTLRPVPGNPISPLTGKPKGAGDCEDSSVLFAAFVWAAGAMLGRPYRGRVEWLPQPGKPQNHVPALACPSQRASHDVESSLAVGCVWAETTLPGARIGEHPYAALAHLGGAEKIEGTYVPTNSSGAPANCVRLLVTNVPRHARVYLRPDTSRGAYAVAGAWLGDRYLVEVPPLVGSTTLTAWVVTPDGTVREGTFPTSVQAIDASALRPSSIAADSWWLRDAAHWPERVTAQSGAIAPAVVLVRVSTLDDGTPVMGDAARVALGRPFSAWAYPASGFPYPVTVTPSPS